VDFDDGISFISLQSLPKVVDVKDYVRGRPVGRGGHSNLGGSMFWDGQSEGYGDLERISGGCFGSVKAGGQLGKEEDRIGEDLDKGGRRMVASVDSR
jgi:hypothetical protein